MPRLFRKGHIPWNKDKKTGFSPWKDKKRSNETKEKIRLALQKGENKICPICEKSFYVSRAYLLTRKYCSRKCMGIAYKSNVISDEQKKILSKSKLGKLNPMFGKIGEKNPRWKGNSIPDTRQRLRKLKKYKEWRKSVFERDKYTCQDCGQKGIYLEAHHKKSWKNYPKLRYIISNGLTLCIKCHNKTKKGRSTND